MTASLRVMLFATALLTLFFILRKVRNSQVRLEDAIFWIFAGALLLLLSIFPGVFFVLSDFAGTIAPVNFVFLFFIFLLLVQSFTLTMRISRADTRIKELAQQLAIEKFERHKNDKG